MKRDLLSVKMEPLNKETNDFIDDFWKPYLSITNHIYDIPVDFYRSLVNQLRQTFAVKFGFKYHDALSWPKTDIDIYMRNK